LATLCIHLTKGQQKIIINTFAVATIRSAPSATNFKSTTITYWNQHFHEEKCFSLQNII